MRAWRHVRWPRLMLALSVSSTTLWLRSVSLVHRGMSFYGSKDTGSLLTLPLVPYEQSSINARVTVNTSVNKSKFLGTERNRKIHRRTLGKIYYIQSDDESRKSYMERWLKEQSKVPFQAIPGNVTNQGDVGIYQHLVPIIQMDFVNHTNEQTDMILILQDNFKVFDQTLGRLERALKWLPNDFDIAQVDCFLTSTTLVMEETRKDFVQVFRQDSFSGGKHAMVWRPSRLDRIHAFFQKLNTTECIQSPFFDDFKMYCLHFDQRHRIGCFHHWKSQDDVSADTVFVPRSQTTIISSSFPRCESSEEKFEFDLPALPSATEKDFYSSIVNVAGEHYTYRVIPPPTGKMAVATAATSRIRVLVGICSANVNFARREVIRQTWGPLAWRVYFIVAGRNFTQVEQEFYHYEDILWVQTEEHYKFGLTPKTMAFLHFSSSMEMDYAFKMDDDIYVNIPELESDLSVQVDYFGLPIVGTGPIRDVSSKFYMSLEEYGPDIFPAYATGGGYAMSQRFVDCAVTKLPLPSSSLSTMWWEDVAIGLLAEACEITLTAATWDPDAIRNPGSYLSKHPKNISIAHRISIENQFRIHRGLDPVLDEDSFVTPRLCPEAE